MSSSGNAYPQGSVIVLSTGTGFVIPPSTSADPTTVTLTIDPGLPTQVVYTYGVGPTIVKASVGNYTANIDTTHMTPGVHWYQWDGTGAVQAIANNWFLVQADPV
jgi:hypothetical protein